MSSVLADRIAQPDLAGLPEWQVAEILNAPDVSLPTIKGPVDTKDVQEFLLASGEWSAIVIAADSLDTPLQVRGLAIAMRDTIRQSGTIRMEVPHIYTAVATAIDGLMASGLISAETREVLLAMAERNQSWAEANEIEVTPRSVGLARGSI